MSKVQKIAFPVLILSTLFLLACPSKDAVLHIAIDGSSTVYPIMEAVVEAFQKTDKNLRVTIGSGGTGSGFAKFCRGEISISDASRPIKEAEAELCKKNGIDFIELPIAYDGITVVVNPKAEWVTNITSEELKRLFEPGAQGKIEKWNQLNPSWPDSEIHLFSPGNDSGTFDYFTSAIVGKEKASRGDLTSSEDDNVLVQGVSTDVYALGYFGFSYYFENKDKLKALSINGVSPSRKTVLDGSYRPLSRPLFIYVSVKELAKAPIANLARYFLDHGAEHIEKVGYFPLDEPVLNLTKRRFSERKMGTMFSRKEDLNLSLEALLKNVQ